MKMIQCEYEESNFVFAYRSRYNQKIFIPIPYVQSKMCTIDCLRILVAQNYRALAFYIVVFKSKIDKLDLISLSS